MEAHEALIVGVLGLAALYAWQRRRDPVDRWLALGVLWICLTGVLGLLLGRFGETVGYVRLALRLTGPPVLLLLCEESVRSAANPGSRRTSVAFAAAVWALSVGALVYYGRGPLGGTNLVLGDLTFGVTSWMAVLGLCFVAALLTVVPAAFRRIFPGFAGLAALLLLGSETLAAIDSRWNSGALSFADSVSYRSLLTFALAALAILKAHQPSWTWLTSGAARDPIGGEPAAGTARAPAAAPAPASTRRAAAASAPKAPSDERDDGDDGDVDGGSDRPATRPSAAAERASSGGRTKKQKKGKKR
jgi:hypothetical protein